MMARISQAGKKNPECPGFSAPPTIDLPAHTGIPPEAEGCSLMCVKPAQEKHELSSVER
jgi:hypothetical protein